MIVDDDDDDGPPQLSAETLKVLQQWQQEQEQNKADNLPQEDWVSVLIKLKFWSRTGSIMKF
jgi:hypothetical protein